MPAIPTHGSTTVEAEAHFCPHQLIPLSTTVTVNFVLDKDPVWSDGIQICPCYGIYDVWKAREDTFVKPVPPAAPDGEACGAMSLPFRALTLATHNTNFNFNFNIKLKTTTRLMVGEISFVHPATLCSRGNSLVFLLLASTAAGEFSLRHTSRLIINDIHQPYPSYRMAPPCHSFGRFISDYQPEPQQRMSHNSASLSPLPPASSSTSPNRSTMGVKVSGTAFTSRLPETSHVIFFIHEYAHFVFFS
jgi:hypothetical protein